MSAGDLFANTSETRVVSPTSLNTWRITCSMGVIPVPPHTIPRCLIPARFVVSLETGLNTLNSPRSVYVRFPSGPSNVAASPTASASSRVVMAPPSYTLTQNSTYPASSSDEMGVYGLETTTPSAPLSDMATCCPTGRPSTCFSEGSAKRNTRVSAETSALDTSLSSTVWPCPGRATSVPSGYALVGLEDLGASPSFIASNLLLGAEQEGQTYSSLSEAKGLSSW
mmetsp:Transcript_2266/g.8926  ORF Transcript_2266/g.8926 Transcript_2266/m.8926 type:complete len:225 (+) Transcript_2266:334-1008(+)